MRLYLRSWETLQHQRARRAGILGALGLALALMQVALRPALPDLESNHYLVTSSPSGAMVCRPAFAKMPGLRLGATLSGTVETSELGPTPWRLTLTRDAGGKPVDFLPRLWLRLPGYKQLEISLQPQPGRIFHGNLEPDWAGGYYYYGPIHWSRTNPWAALALLALTLSLAQLGFYYRARQSWLKSQRIHRQQGLKPGTELGGYWIEDNLGQGGMGKVLRARNLATSEPVAIKVLFESASLDPVSRRRFILEIDALRRLHHPNVVLILDWGEVDNQLFLVQEFLDGASLDKSWENRHPWAEIRPLAEQIARALCYVHSQGLVHRDLKPANLVVLKDGRVKLLDFGIASAANQEASSIRGTPGFMSPEQISGGPVDWRSDLYSFGAMLHQALTGQPLYADSVHVMDLLRRHVEEPAPPIPESLAPPEVVTFVARLLEKSPEHRFSTPLEFQQACDRVLGSR